VDNIQEEDVFKELGGESLLAIQMMQAVRNKIGIQLEIAHVFAYPSLGELAKFIFELSQKKIERKKQTLQQTNSLQAVEKLEEIKSAEQSEVFHPNKILESKKSKDLPRKTILLFAGQGAQRLGMCEGMLEDEEARIVFEEAERILGIDIVAKCKDACAMSQTEFVQVALYVSAIAKIAQLKSTRPQLFESVIAVAGLSVGEFAALTIAGVLKFEDALKLVHYRAVAMKKQVDQVPTGMVSVFGPTRVQLEEFLVKFPEMHISNYLTDNQHTVCGPSETCDLFVEKLADKVTANINVIDVCRLRVVGAFHSPYMQTAGDLVAPLIDGVKLHNPKYPIIMNVSGESLTDPESIRNELKKQLVSSVQWKEAMQTAVRMGIRHFVEISPSSVLAAIVRQRIVDCEQAKCTTEFVKI
jgi:[acyl-carrier-protein] S-malonyltransferase